MQKHVDGILVPIKLEVNDSGISLKDLVALLRKRMLPIGIIVVLGTCIPIIASYFIEPVYRSTITFLPVVDSEQSGALGGLASQFGGLSALAGINLSPDSNKKVIGRAALQSRQFINRFIAEQELLPVLFSDLWDAASGSWIDPESTPTTEEGFRLFVNDILHIDEDRQTGLIKLSIEWTDPELAASWANTLIEKINQQLREESIEEANQSINYLNEQLDETLISEIRLSIYRLLENQIQRVMLANVRDDYVFEVVDRALVPDADKQIWPVRRIIAVLSLLVSLVVGVGLVLLYDLTRGRIEPSTDPVLD